MATVNRARLSEVFLSPVSPQAKSGQIALTGLRLLAGLLWLENVVWKVPPDFGENTGGGLYFWTGLAVKYPVFDPFTWLVEKAVLPNFTLFGWAVLVTETALAVLLLTGTAVRPAALLGVAQSLAIGLSVAESEAPNEWPWAYAMMIGIHAVLLFTPCAQYAAVDALAGGTAAAARRLLGGWGLVSGLIGVIAVWIYVSSDRNAHVGVRDWELSFGDFNLRGALTLVVVALARLAAALLGQAVVAFAGAAVATAAAVSIWVQTGRTEVWLGATNSTAVVFASAAVVGLGAGLKLKAEKGVNVG
jgi:hypothetical protein